MILINSAIIPNDTYISSRIVQDDLKELREKGHLIEEYADKKIAHLDKKEPKIIPTFSNADNSIDFLDKLYRKYHLIFHAESTIESVMPIYQYDWQQIFDYPWRIKKLKADS